MHRIPLLIVAFSLFAQDVKPPAKKPGLPLKPAEHPRLNALVADVAKAVNTAPVDQIFLAPGAEIGVRPKQCAAYCGADIANRVRIHFASEQSGFPDSIDCSHSLSRTTEAQSSATGPADSGKD